MDGTAHRKIELQSPADLTHITSHIREAATQRLNNALPPSDASHPQEPDAYRAKVEELVESFVSDVLQGLRSNVSINGLDVVSNLEGDAAKQPSVVEVEEFEPYDENLRAKVADMVKKRDELIKNISEKRRTAPKLAAETHMKELKAEMETQDKAWEEQERAMQIVNERDLVDVEIKRGEEMSRNWEKAVEGLGRLKGGLGETRARLERAGDVVGYLEGGKKEKP
ncbi:hypothetical protein K504DRAFT_465248 [Pleomassaria siparia CBS 279.74]|uniref:Kinetochore protein mis14 n=1 Tax=Pleomassaria siparia CBS 279.74 TaxID=1314801 RepID=A0A6G1KFE4_9PLEO|nr:hypothetical protein K504DRAFT_465248 [Pleomassaria siparia CBS 279.74]